jgi:hypothetical protein
MVTVQFYAIRQDFVFDGHAYWVTGQPDYVPYGSLPRTRDAFLYSPAFAQAISPLTWLPWPAFATVWVTAEACAFLWLLRPLGWKWALPLMLWCVPELAIGNVLGFLGVALVLAIHRPAAWSAMLLTKPTLGIGAIWHVTRGEWRSFGVATTTTAAIVAVSFVVDPAMWSAWMWFLLDQTGESAGFLPVRLLLALVLVVLAGRTGTAWLLAPALLIAAPVLGGSASLTILAAIPRLADCGQGSADADDPDNVNSSATMKEAGNPGDRGLRNLP